jgi:hypothetical protein
LHANEPAEAADERPQMTMRVAPWRSTLKGGPLRQISRKIMPKADPKLSAVKTESDVHFLTDVIRDTRCGSATSHLF